MKRHNNDQWLACFGQGISYCIFAVLYLLITTGCAKGDDPETVALIKKHLSQRSYQVNTEGNIYSVNIPNDRASLEVLPHLNKLKDLSMLVISYESLSDKDLSKLPALPRLIMFGTRSNLITDEGLQYLAGMKSLKQLDITGAAIAGPGLADLKPLTELEKLELNSTQIDDSAMPIVANNFSKLSELRLNETNVTAKGLMQLVDLHWLNKLEYPDDIVGAGGDAKERRKRRMEILGRFSAAHIASKQIARAAGINVPEDFKSPFSEIGLNYKDEQEE